MVKQDQARHPEKALAGKLFSAADAQRQECDDLMRIEELGEAGQGPPAPLALKAAEAGSRVSKAGVPTVGGRVARGLHQPRRERKRTGRLGAPLLRTAEAEMAVLVPEECGAILGFLAKAEESPHRTMQ